MKGVEDGITDEPCECNHPKHRHWDSLKGCYDCFCSGFFPPVARPTPPLDELLRNVRPATPEELAAQRESYGKNYKPGPRQATPFMPKVVCGSCGSEPYQWCGRGVGRGQVTAISTACFEPKTAVVPVGMPAAVPVEERTASMTKKCTCKNTHGHEGCVAAVDVSCGCIMHDDEAEEPSPIPEERTAEMEQPQLKYLIEKIIRDVAELPDRNSPDDWPEAMIVTDKELAGILESRLLDHIEGKPK